MGHEDNLRESEVFRTRPMLLVPGARLDAESQDGDESENEQVRHGETLRDCIGGFLHGR